MRLQGRAIGGKHMRISGGWADGAARRASPNINRGHQSRECIVIHYTAGYTAASAIATFANASGKSNLIKALQFMRDVVIESASVIQPGQSFSVQPFQLDASSAGQPSIFEVTFLLGKVRYQYGFAMTAQRIISEHLLVYKTAKPQRWFTRHFDADTGKDIYTYSSSLKGAKSLWESATRPNALFLSMAVQLNSAALRPTSARKAGWETISSTLAPTAQPSGLPP